MKKAYVLLIVVSIALKTQAQWVEKNNGLSNKAINAITTSGTNLFAGTHNGVYLSADNGASWTDVTNGIGSDWGLPTVFISSLAASGSNLYAGSDGVYLSTNNGASWTHLSPVSGTLVQSVAVKGDNLFACGEAVFRSTDNGNSWTDFPTLVDIHSIVRIIGSGSNIYAVTYRPGVYLLGNNDTNWIAANIGLAALPLYGTLVSLTESGSNLFAATYAGVFRSTDNGTNWTPISQPTTNVRSLAVSGNNLFVGGDSGIWSRPLSDLNLTITAFTPLSGTMGTEVTIEGTGFDPTPANNVIEFNGVRAIVTASTATTITALVPFDAGSGPISVTAYGQTTSTQVFTVIKLTQNISFNPIPDQTYRGRSSDVIVSATASSGLDVTYNRNSDNIFILPYSVGLVREGYVGLEKAGRASITANQAGNNSFDAAIPVTQSFCIKPYQPWISLLNTNAGTVILIRKSPDFDGSPDQIPNTGNQWYRGGTPIAGATNDSLQVTTAGVYQVQVQVDDCVSEFSSEQAIIITGDISTPNERVVVYPNPVETYLELKGIAAEIKRAQLFDMTGSAVPIFLEKESDVYKANVQYLSAGLYLLRVDDKISVRTIKFVKK